MTNMAMTETKATTTASKPSQHFRSEHQDIQTHLTHVEEWAGSLSKGNSKDQKETSEKIVNFFKQHIEPHAQWEEKYLYPAVDRRVGKNKDVFTASMRYEHRIVGRWIGELDKMSQQSPLPSEKFARKTDQLLGLIKAHFEEEEEVLLPILDKSMSAAEFEKEIPIQQH